MNRSGVGHPHPTPAGVMALGILVALTTAPAAGADRYPGRTAGEAQHEMAVSLRVTPKTIPRGGVLTFRGAGWPARTRVTLLVGPPASEADPVGSVRTNARGRFLRRLRISRTATPGAYVALACRAGCRVKATATFRIV